MQQTDRYRRYLPLCRRNLSSPRNLIQVSAGFSLTFLLVQNASSLPNVLDGSSAVRQNLISHSTHDSNSFEVTVSLITAPNNAKSKLFLMDYPDLQRTLVWTECEFKLEWWMLQVDRLFAKELSCRTFSLTEKWPESKGNAPVLSLFYQQLNWTHNCSSLNDESNREWRDVLWGMTVSDIVVHPSPGSDTLTRMYKTQGASELDHNGNNHVKRQELKARGSRTHRGTRGWQFTIRITPSDRNEAAVRFSFFHSFLSLHFNIGHMNSIVTTRSGQLIDVMHIGWEKWSVFCVISITYISQEQLKFYHEGWWLIRLVWAVVGLVWTQDGR